MPTSRTSGTRTAGDEVTDPTDPGPQRSSTDLRSDGEVRDPEHTRGTSPREGDGRGRDATSPGEIPAKGWKDVAKRVKEQLKEDNVALLSAGVAFYGLLALFPALIAAISMWGLVAEPATVERHIESITDALPEEAAGLITEQMRSVAQSSGGGLGFGVVFGILAALWAASSGMKHLMVAIGVAYDEREGRGFVKLRGLAVLLTLGAVVFVLVAVAVIAVVPAVLDGTALGGAGRAFARWLPYVALAGGFMLGLSVLYRLGPDRDDPRWRWVTWGAVLATLVWIGASLAFSFYASNFGSYNETYGSVGAVVILMLWLALTAFAVLLGAEVNAEIEAQTAEDSTVGPEAPMGERGAQKADELGRAHP